MKRLNANTKKPFNRGDVREDGFFFLGYQKTINKQGLFYESWVRPEVWNKQTKGEKRTIERHVRRTLSHIKSKAKKNNVPFDLPVEYAMSIFTDICPALKTKLTWTEQNGKNKNSPSLDKIIPELGYIKGNVMWLSYKANLMKNNATASELKKFAEWVLSGNLSNAKGINP